VSATDVISGFYISLSKSLVSNIEQGSGQFSEAYLCYAPGAFAKVFLPGFVL
jgi:hypothetical protein